MTGAFDPEDFIAGKVVQANFLQTLKTTGGDDDDDDKHEIPPDVGFEEEEDPVDGVASDDLDSSGTTKHPVDSTFCDTLEEYTIALPNSGIRKRLLQPGQGPIVPPESKVSYHYVCYLPDGTIFDSSRKRKQEMVLRIGPGNAMLLYHTALGSMAPKELSRFWVPPEEAYGDNGLFTLVPPKSPIIVELEILRFEPPVKLLQPRELAERLAAAKDDKERGNEKLKTKFYRQAIKAYNSGLAKLQGNDVEDTEEKLLLQAQLRLNACQASLDLALGLRHDRNPMVNPPKLFEDCIKFANQVLAVATLPPTCLAKAYFRKARACHETKDLSNGLDAIQKAAKLSPSDAEVKALLNRFEATVGQMKVEREKAFKANLQRAFQSGS